MVGLSIKVSTNSKNYIYITLQSYQMQVHDLQIETESSIINNNTETSNEDIDAYIAPQIRLPENTAKVISSYHKKIETLPLSTSIPIYKTFLVKSYKSLGHRP